MSAIFIVIKMLKPDDDQRQQREQGRHIWKPQSAVEDHHQPLSFARAADLHQHQLQHQQFSLIVILIPTWKLSEAPKIPGNP